MPEVKIGKKKIKLPYTKSGKKLAMKLRKKKKKQMKYLHHIQVEVYKYITKVIWNRNSIKKP